MFDLPCIDNIQKVQGQARYDLIGVHDTCDEYVFLAMPGDYLAEDDKGNWTLLDKEEGEQYLRDNNIVTLKSSNP